MPDLSAYRERFAAVGAYDNYGRHYIHGTSVRDYADAALTALAEALGEAEALNDQWEVKAADIMRERNEAEADAKKWQSRQRVTEQKLEYEEKLRGIARAELAELKARRCGTCRYAEEEFTLPPGEHELLPEGADVSTCRNGVAWFSDDKSINPSCSAAHSTRGWRDD